MTSASASDPYVASMLVTHTNGSVSGLAADIAYDVQVDGMTVTVKKQVNVWAELSENKKNQFQTFVNGILQLA